MGSKDQKPTEKSDDDLLTTLGAQFRGRFCRQKFGWPRKTCTLPKGHPKKGPFGGHKA